MLESVPTREGNVPRLNTHPPRSGPWRRGGCPACPVGLLRRIRPVPRPGRPGRGGGSQLARSSDPAQPSSLREPGAQGPASPQAPEAAVWIPWTVTHGDATAFRSPRWAWGRGARPVGGCGKDPGALQDTVLGLSPGPPAHLLG